ncbi:hypothetical protein [Cyanobium sp. ATX-6F1]|uniref:hypothetical protein n=1 Tax=Cyanobium sp. ATX-6F1 TaxID=3137388 RepID=UPI0039BDFD26
MTLSSLAGGLNLSGAVSSAGGTISLSASGATQLAAGSSLTSPGALISVNSSGPLSLLSARIDASGASAGGTVQLDGSSISLASTSLNTSGTNDGGAIQIGLKALPSNVTISNSSLIADPPALGGSITIDGVNIAISGSTLNVFGLSGGSIVLGSGNTATLSLDAFTSLVGGSGASFNLFGGSILNNASIVGGKLFVNGVAVGSSAPLTSTTIPLLVTFLQTIDPIQPGLIDSTTDYSDPGSPLVTQWERLGIDPLTITLTQSLFLFSDAFLYQDEAITPIWDWARLDLFNERSQRSLYDITLTVDRDLDRLGTSFQQDSLVYIMLLREATGAAPGVTTAEIKVPSGGTGLDETAFYLKLEQQLYPSQAFAGRWPEGSLLSLSANAFGLFDRAVQQLTPFRCRISSTPMSSGRWKKPPLSWVSIPPTAKPCRPLPVAAKFARRDPSGPRKDSSRPTMNHPNSHRPSRSLAVSLPLLLGLALATPAAQATPPGAAAQLLARSSESTSPSTRPCTTRRSCASASAKPRGKPPVPRRMPSSI